MTSPHTTVSARLEADVQSATRIELQVAVARRAGLTIDETLTVTVDGTAVEPVEVGAPDGGVVHLLQGTAGRLEVAYDATVGGVGEQAVVTEREHVELTRPSRYAESDKLAGFAQREFGTGREPAELVHDVASWVSGRLSYVPGSSGPTDGATDTLLLGQGVCRDYTHLTMGLLRALDVPARLVAVYAPGCDPMDFHAVVEVAVDGVWWCLDATGLAPRQSLRRISTGRDAADTAFLTNHGGLLTLERSEVFAVVSGDLPVDDPRDDVWLA
jgi:transglutaminase-like putative cysteine protease